VNPERRLLYLHGFASSPRGRKVELLQKLLGPRGFEILAPDLNVPSFALLDFEAIARAALVAARSTPDVVVGSSLGALVALEIARRGVPAPLVLLAPAIGVADRWAGELPDGDPVRMLHHGTGREEPIHRAFFEQMEHVRPEVDPPKPPVTIVMGRKDESVPFDRVASVWASWRKSGRLRPGSRFVEIPGGDHGLTEFGEILAAAIRGRVATVER